MIKFFYPQNNFKNLFIYLFIYLGKSRENVKVNSNRLPKSTNVNGKSIKKNSRIAEGSINTLQM